MTLQQLKYAITIADCGSMNEASKELFIAQPTLSNSIRELEREIGISIFIRSNKGIMVSPEGLEFMGYARQVLTQTELLEEKYMGKKSRKISFSVSTQHYPFSVRAFVDMIREYNADEYDFQLRETRTYEIIEDVKNFTSEIGIIYLNDYNEVVLNKLLKERELIFTELLCAKPHIFIGKNNPLAEKKSVTLEDLEDYPYLSFEQGNNNSFYFSEEILSTISRKKLIKLSDRATLLNLLIGLNGYTICAGITSEELNGEDKIAIPLDVPNETIRVGYIRRKDSNLTELGKQYIEKLIEAIDL